MGFLVLHLLEGRNWNPDKDKEGASDRCFVTFKIVSNESGQVQAKVKSKAVKKNPNPTWNEKLSLPLDDLKGFNLNILLYDVKGLGTKQPVGHASFPLEFLTHTQPSSPNTMDKWFNIQGATGQIHVDLAFKPDSKHTIQIQYGNDELFDFDLHREVRLTTQMDLLCQLVKAPGSPEQYILQLKDQEKEITQELLKDQKFKVPYQAIVKLVIKPNLQVQSVLEALTSPNQELKKKAFFELKSKLQDREFAQMFISQNGITAVTAVIVDSSGNTLAYALQALDSCMNYGFGWDQLSPVMIEKIVSFMDNNNINVKGGALKIAVHLSSSKNHGYPLIVNAIAKTDSQNKVSTFEKLIQELKETDVHTQLTTVAFLNCMISSAPEKTREKLIADLDANGLTRTLRNQIATTSGTIDPEIKEQIARFIKVKSNLDKDPVLYDRQNEDHEAELMSLWQLVFPKRQLDGRVSEQWKLMGFQGTDPATDFRAMGIMALKHLLYFGRTYTKTMQAIMERQSDNNPNYYPVAVAAINFSKMIYDQFSSADRDSNLRLLLDHEHSVEEIYCLSLQTFDRVWDETKSTYFDFSIIMGSLIDEMGIRLPNSSTLDQLRKEFSSIKLKEKKRGDTTRPDKKAGSWQGRHASSKGNLKVPTVPEFHAAVLAGDTKKVSDMIKEGVNIDELGANSSSALHVAVNSNNVDMVRLLLWKDASVDVRNDAGWTPLHEACMSSTAEICEILLDKGANPNSETNDGVSPLHYLVSRKFDDISALSEVIQELVAKGADVNHCKNSNTETPLHYSVVKGMADNTKILLGHGADINAKSKRGFTPLHIAIMTASKELIEILLESGADHTIPCKDGQGCLDIAKPDVKTVITAFLARKEKQQSIRNSIAKIQIGKKGAPPPTPPRKPGQMNSTQEVAALPFFHGNISRERAEQLATSLGTDAFLLRTSSVRSCFAITVYHNKAREVVHFLIYPQNSGNYALQNCDEDINSYKNVTELCQKSPLLRGHTSVPVPKEEVMASPRAGLNQKMENVQAMLQKAIQAQEDIMWRPSLKKALTDLAQQL
eukprot:TRINITY_DN2604_c0_g1_i1.p1 TRINITY_DN2604_c0_g1~~TRINITY_DN2604_c0_g1_i1.p1  ORF type:complete len:1059 (-),score=337.43 TRINITY_DN2604_c0_g1_i1:28-3204(-)